MLSRAGGWEAKKAVSWRQNGREILTVEEALLYPHSSPLHNQGTPQLLGTLTVDCSQLCQRDITSLELPYTQGRCFALLWTHSLGISLIQGVINVELQSLGPCASVCDINQGPPNSRTLYNQWRLLLQLPHSSTCLLPHVPLLLIIIFLRAVQAHTCIFLHFSVHFQGSSSH